MKTLKRSWSIEEKITTLKDVKSLSVIAGSMVYFLRHIIIEKDRHYEEKGGAELTSK